MATVESDTLLKVLKADDDDAFKLNVLEALGGLLLMSHWLRGAFTWTHHTGAIKYDTDAQRQNYDRLDRNLSIYEELLWKIVPPRAMLQQLRLWREQGFIDEDFMRLLQADEMGRYDRDDADVQAVIDRGNTVAGRDDIPLR